jgi:5'-methylthioadenosine phosphorylase
MNKKLGIIGGSGLYEIDGLENIEKIKISTPFGEPSGDIIQGTIDSSPICFLPRHGAGHKLSPSEINYRANIFAMKKLEVTHIVSISAVGSLKNDLCPGDFLAVDQLIDRTKGIRESTFFSEGIAAHVGFADPMCESLRQAVIKAAQKNGRKIHEKGTYVCMEGPQFSTRAESNLYRSWGADVIGMTNIPESKLAREAEICYAALALITDYDCWKEEESVSVQAVINTLKRNVEGAKKIIKALPDFIGKEDACECENALKYAIMTNRDLIPEKIKNDLDILIKKYF